MNGNGKKKKKRKPKIRKIIKDPAHTQQKTRGKVENI